MNQEILKAKEAIVDEVVENIKNSQSVMIVEYRGLTVDETINVRRALREVGASMRVYKNSLVERAAEKLGHEDLKSMLQGPNAVVFSKDVIAGPKVVAKFAKKYENLVIKGGLAEGKVLNESEMKSVAALPGREGLISMLLSCLQAPVRQFACAVKAVADKN